VLLVANHVRERAARWAGAHSSEELSPPPQQMSSVLTRTAPTRDLPPARHGDLALRRARSHPAEMSDLGLTLSAVSKAGLSYLKAILDPGLRRKLDEEITAHVLAEIPLVLHLLEERIEDVRASGCSVHEANIVAQQVFEAQRRTLDGAKRRRLANVLVNGLSSPRWGLAKHRLLIRLTSQLEEEHITVLRWYARTPEEEQQPEATGAFSERFTEVQIGPNAYRITQTPEQCERTDLEEALAQELISCGVLLETPKPKVHRDQDELYRRGRVEDVELEWEREVTSIGRALLAHLRDPDLQNAATNRHDEYEVATRNQE